MLASEGLLLDSLLAEWQQTPGLQDYEPLLLSAVAGEGDSAMFRGRPLAFCPLEEVDRSQIAMLLVLDSALVVESAQSLLKQLACPVIGNWQNLSPLAAEAFTGQQQAGFYAVPQAAATAIAMLLEHLPCESIDATMLLPASVYGRAGVEELATQTVKLLNGQAIEPGVFNQQLSFNCYPVAGSDTELAEVLQRELMVTFADADVHVSGIQVPVFHGLGVQLSVICRDEVDVDKLQRECRGSENLAWQTDASQCSVMAASQQQGQVVVGNVRQSQVDPYRLDAWLAFDDVQLYVRKSLLSAAQILLKHDL